MSEFALMPDFTFFIVEANVLLILTFVLYWLFRNQIRIWQRRLCLLAIMALSFGIPLLKLFDPFGFNEIYTVPLYQLKEIHIAPSISEQGIVETSEWAYDRLYLTVTGLVILIFAVRLSLVMLRFRMAKKEKLHGLRITCMPNQGCYSFMGYIQLDPSLSADAKEMVLQHEKIHVARKHSYDIILTEFLHSFFWINPVMVFLKKELVDVHEYEVDQIMYRRHKTDYMEFLLAYSLGTNSTQYLLTNQFYSKNRLIKRLHFMKTKTKNNWAFALVLPLVAGSFALVSWTMKENEPQTPPVSATNQLVEGEVEKMPEFKGGQEALVAYLTKNIIYPESAREGKIEGSVFISFLVESSGKVSKCAVKKSVHPDLDAEALRVVSAMPDWIPGEKNGKVVNAEMILPISFKL